MNRKRWKRPRGDDNIGTKRVKFSRERGDQLGAVIVIAILDLEIPADDPAVLAQSPRPSLCLLGNLGLRENADAMNPLLSARLRCEQHQARCRRGERAMAEHRR